MPGKASMSLCRGPDDNHYGGDEEEATVEVCLNEEVEVRTEVELRMFFTVGVCLNEAVEVKASVTVGLQTISCYLQMPTHAAYCMLTM